MNKQICIITFLLTCRICGAQNLVPNGDFEQYSSCPSFWTQIDSALFWFTPTTGTPDYYNQCTTFSLVGVPNNWGGYQQALSGVAYSGISIFYIYLPNYREYLEVELTSPLVANSCYHFQMFANLPDTLKYTTSSIGTYFSDTLVKNITSSIPLSFIPQISCTTGNEPDTMNWTLIQGNYMAHGGEKYLIIGNFKDDANTDTTLIYSNGYPGVYCYIDDVSLVQIPPCNTGIEEQIQNASINIYPNPAMDKLIVTVNTKELSEIILYDIASRKLLQTKFTNSVSLNTEQLAKGLYLYEVRSRDGLCKKGKVVKE